MKMFTDETLDTMNALDKGTYILTRDAVTAWCERGDKSLMPIACEKAGLSEEEILSYWLS